jgi:hypothetical protein
VAAATAGLSDRGREVLAAVALLRPGTTPSEAARLLDLRPAELLDLLEEADRQGVATIRAGRVHFAHPFYRAVLCGSLTPTAQRRVHQGVAERLAQPTTEAEVLIMAWHLSNAELAVPARHHDLFVRAGDHCFANCEWLEAARYYRLA